MLVWGCVPVPARSPYLLCVCGMAACGPAGPALTLQDGHRTKPVVWSRVRDWAGWGGRPMPGQVMPCSAIHAARVVALRLVQSPWYWGRRALRSLSLACWQGGQRVPLVGVPHRIQGRRGIS